MKAQPNFAVLLQGFFTQRLMHQRNASPHTIKSYRDTFCLLLKFTHQRLGKEPSRLELNDIDTTLISAFLDEMESKRQIGARSRNVRLAAIRSFFRYAALEAPAQSAQIQRVLSIPSKRHTKRIVSFLTKDEVSALLAAPDRTRWIGRRDYALLLVALQTGLRLSELTSLQKHNLILDSTGAHIRVTGKGGKERSTPLTRQAVEILQAWLNELSDASEFLFPNARKGRLSADGMQYVVNKHVASASERCPSLKGKRVTPHVLRHTTAMELLQAGVDRAMIALWLGHESLDTTQVHMHANIALKQQILAKTTMPDGLPGFYKPDDRLLAFLRSL
ncbi:MAG: site-specific integrase [Candidatus Obscuribacterales bacterium]|nr:site-specific integrase [Candidatus Obscuribacterales bacterium]